MRLLTGPESLVSVAPRNPLLNIARMRYVEVHREKPVWKLAMQPTPPPPLVPAASPCGGAAQQLLTPLRLSPTPPIPPLALQASGISTGPAGPTVAPGSMEAAGIGMAAAASRPVAWLAPASFARQRVGSLLAPQYLLPDAVTPPQQQQQVEAVAAAGRQRSSPVLLAADATASAAVSPSARGTTASVSTSSMLLSVGGGGGGGGGSPLPLPLLAGPPIFGHSPEAHKYAAEAQALAAAAAGGGASADPRVPSASHFDISYESLQLGRMVGQGAFGRVYKARWRGSTVAVKMLTCQNLREDAVAEFRAEVSVLAALRHPNILL